MGLLDKFRRKKATTMVHDITDNQLRAEAGITALKGSEQTDNRIQWTDESLIDDLNFLADTITELLKKKKRTPQDDMVLAKLMQEHSLISSRRYNYKTGVPFAGAGESQSMSDRYSGLEVLQACNEGFEEFDDLLKAMHRYFTQISFKDKHGEPSPTVMINTPALLTRSGSPIGETAEGKKVEVT